MWQDLGQRKVTTCRSIGSIDARAPRPFVCRTGTSVGSGPLPETSLDRRDSAPPTPTRGGRAMVRQPVHIASVRWSVGSPGRQTIASSHPPASTRTQPRTRAPTLVARLSSHMCLAKKASDRRKILFHLRCCVSAAVQVCPWAPLYCSRRGSSAQAFGKRPCLHVSAGLWTRPRRCPSRNSQTTILRKQQTRRV